jgi:hypothetical protein
MFTPIELTGSNRYAVAAAILKAVANAGQCATFYVDYTGTLFVTVGAPLSSLQLVQSSPWWAKLRGFVQLTPSATFGAERRPIY